MTLGYIPKHPSIVIILYNNIPPSTLKTTGESVNSKVKSTYNTSAFSMPIRIHVATDNMVALSHIEFISTCGFFFCTDYQNAARSQCGVSSHLK